MATHKPLQIYNYKLIDYIKILLVGIDIDLLLRKLDFKSEYISNTNEISRKQTFDYHFCKITVYDSGIVLFAGSIHKLYNSLKGVKAPNYKPLTEKQIENGIKDCYKGFNGNQFTIDNILEVKKNLLKLFNCKPHQMIFQNTEFGVNLGTSFDPKLFIKGLLYQKGKLFEYRFDNNYAQLEHQRYSLKIYNKSYQYGMDKNVLRVEIKIRKSQELKLLQIETFADITENTLNNAKDLLLKRFDEVVYYDYTINKKKLTKKQKILLKDYSRQLFWLDDIKPNHRDRHKKRLHDLAVNNSENLHKKIMKMINRKCVIINRLSEHQKCVTNNSSSIVVNNTQKGLKKTVRFCPITKVDISMQKPDSFLLSNTGLKHLKKTNEELFNLFAKIYLTGHENKREKTIYDRIAKQIRNRYYNNRSLYAEDQSRLF